MHVLLLIICEWKGTKVTHALSLSLSLTLSHTHTHTHTQYADPVADLLDKYNTFSGRLFRESCVFHKGNYVKVSRHHHPFDIFS